MHLRIIIVIAGLSLALTACDKKAETPRPLSCVTADGSAVPCPSGGGGAHTDPGAPEQQK